MKLNKGSDGEGRGGIFRDLKLLASYLGVPAGGFSLDLHNGQIIVVQIAKKFQLQFQRSRGVKSDGAGCLEGVQHSKAVELIEERIFPHMLHRFGKFGGLDVTVVDCKVTHCVWRLKERP